MPYSHIYIWDIRFEISISISLLFLSRKKNIYIYFVLRYRLTCSLNSRSSCDRGYRKIFMMSPSVGATQDIVIFPGRSSARNLSAFLFFPFFFFLIVELIQPILPYNKKIITGKREKHAFFFWCLVKVGKNKSIWHGNYSSSPFISHASWGKRWELQKEKHWSLDLDPWKKSASRWDIMKVSVWSINCILRSYMFKETKYKDLFKTVQDQQLYIVILCMHKHELLSIF